MQARKLNQQNFATALIIMIAIILLLFIPFFRTVQGNPTFPNSETYVHFNALTTHSQANLFDMLLGQLTSVFTEQVLAIVLPLLFGLLSLLLIVAILRILKLGIYEYFYTLIILALTPAFIATFVGISIYSVLFFLALLVIWLFLKKNNFYLLGLAALYLFDPFLGLVAGLVLVLLELKNKARRNSLFVLLTLLAIQIISLIFSLPTTYFASSSFAFSVEQLFTFFGARYGYSLFILILGLFGFYKYMSKRLDPAVFLYIALIILSLFYAPIRLLCIVFLAFYSAKAFDYLVLRKWKVVFLGQLILVLFVCILLFSTMTYLKEDLQKQPIHQEVKALQDLSNFYTVYKVPKTAKILSSPEYSSFIQYYAGSPALQKQTGRIIHSNLSLHEELFQSRDYDFVQQIFQEEHVAFIFIDGTMLSGKVWQRPDEGLLFIMENNDNFLKVYSQNNILIYYNTLWNQTQTK